MVIWLDGALTDAGTARIDPADRGVTLGDGLFETIAVRGGCIQRLDSHLDRARAGAAIIGLVLPDVAYPAIFAATLGANGLTDGVLRLTITRGIAGRGLLPPDIVRPTIMVTASPASPAPGPARCIVAARTRRNEHSPLCRVKSLNYLDNVLARMEAQERGADDAILLNTAGRVAESSAANLFIVRNGALHTPPLAEGALPGTMRAEVLRLTGGVETPLSTDDVMEADEAFLTNSLGIRPIIELDGVAVRRGGVAESLIVFSSGASPVV